MQYGMFFQESEAIARRYPDLLRAVEQVDVQLSGISSPEPLRPADFASVLGAEENQVASVFDLLAQKGVLLTEAMVECERCQNLMPAAAFRQAVDDEDKFECTACGRVFPPASEPIPIYRMTGHTLTRTQADAQSRNARGSEMFKASSSDDPLSERAQLVLVAMLELGSIDSDTRTTTAEISVRAIGGQADANSLKTVMSELRTRGLIKTKTGSGGGCWLTEKGLARAQKLRP